MGFLDNKEAAPRDSAYLDIPGDGNKKAIRPGAKAPTTVWVHKIHRVEETSASGETTVLRNYSTVMCTSTGRGGVGCAFCTTPDPLWSKLSAENQFNRKQTRVDFPKTPTHVMPVVDLDLNAVKIMKGGNGLYEPMDQWYDIQKSESDKDLRRCSWSVWKSGKGIKTQYAASRHDPSPFEFTPEIEAASKVALDKALADLRVPSDKIRERMYGEAGDDSLVVPTTTINRVTTTAEVKPAVFDPPPFEPTTTPTQVKAAPVAAPAPAKNEQQAALKEFIDWLQQQPEFTGSGLVSTLIPFVREHLKGDINYHKLDVAGLNGLRFFLADKLSTIRAGK